MGAGCSVESCCGLGDNIAWAHGPNAVSEYRPGESPETFREVAEPAPPSAVWHAEEQQVDTDELNIYFERDYRQGGVFKHRDYTNDWVDSTTLVFKHRGTGIQVWGDAIDLSGGHPGARVVYHYTAPKWFGNITAPAREAVEIFASLVTEGQGANAWWGRGVYTVPRAPHQWDTVEQLLDNNFRNMMARDRESKGQAFVDKEYRPRVAFCVPILADPDSLYDVSVRPTPEMVAKGKGPGVNLADKLLDEPGKPRRCCVVVRVEGATGKVEGARARLVETLRARAKAAAQRLGEDNTDAVAAADRLGRVLLHRGLYAEAEPVLRDVLERTERALGPEHPSTLISVGNLAVLLEKLGRLQEAEPLYRRALEAKERTLGPEHPSTLTSVYNLALLLEDLGRLGEAEPMFRRAAEAGERVLGPEHPHTLQFARTLARVQKARGQGRG